MATILIVDDLHANRSVMAATLLHRGHRIVEAANGAEALALIQRDRPDLVITDLLMPVMDGYELVRQLRLDPATRRLPVVFYTAHYGEREARQLAESSGVAWVLTKPIEPLEVMRVVERVLAHPLDAEPQPAGPLSPEFDRDHLRLLTDKLSAEAEDSRYANARLRALVNIGLELASERDPDSLIRKVCTVSRDLFAATYVTIGILNRHEQTISLLVTDGTDAAAWVAPGDRAPGMLSSVVEERRLVKGVNVSGDPTAVRLPPSHPPIKHYLVAPVASPGNVYGWLCLVRNDDIGFAADDEQLVLALAGLLGRIYENGYFYSIAKKRAEALEQEVMVRQSVELALRHERDRSKQYLDTAQVLLVAVNRQGRIESANRYASVLLGWPEEELRGRNFANLAPEYLRPALAAWINAAPFDDTEVIERPLVRRSGEQRLIAWRRTALKAPDGAAIGVLLSGTDVTDQNRAIEALRVAEERMRFALQASDVGIWDLDYVAGTLRWSETLERQYGLAPGTFPGTFEAFVELVHPQDRAATVETLTEAARTGADFTVENRALHADGTVRRLSGAGRILLDQNGQPIRGVGISMDVTDRRSLEEQYQQAQKMEAVGRLASGVAHDFNNLLTAILGYCELLQTDLAAGDPRRADLAGIQRAGTSAATLTRQLLAFSRKQIIEPRQVDLNLLVKGLQGMLSRMIGEDVRVILQLTPETGAVMADHGQLEQIVMNLAVNARDAMLHGGTLTISTSETYIDATVGGLAPGPYVVLTVTDTGSGMTADVQARLFEPFFTTKEVGKGTGLGLATVHGIVMRCGGRINVQSEPGSGTTFEVFFPRSDQAPVEAVRQRPGVAPRARGELILVVEDDIEIRSLVLILLERLGFHVLLAENADRAVELFAANPEIAVILTDVVMPGSSGPELTLRLMQQRPGLKVIYMSGYTEDALGTHGVDQSNIAFLQKPFTSEALGLKIREVLDS